MEPIEHKYIVVEKKLIRGIEIEIWSYEAANSFIGVILLGDRVVFTHWCPSSYLATDEAISMIFKMW